jgi:hypothetical protein
MSIFTLPLCLPPRVKSPYFTRTLLYLWVKCHKDKDDQTGVKNKVPEHKVTRRSRTRTNEEAAYHDAEELGSPVAERERDGRDDKEDDSVDEEEENDKNDVDIYMMPWMMRMMLRTKTKLMRWVML